MLTLNIPKPVKCEGCDTVLTKRLFKTVGLGFHDFSCPTCFKGYKVESELDETGLTYTATATEKTSLDVYVVIGTAQDLLPESVPRAPSMFPLTVSVDTSYGKHVSVLDIQESYMGVYGGAQAMVHDNVHLHLVQTATDNKVYSVIPASIVDEIGTAEMVAFYRMFTDTLRTLAKCIKKNPKVPALTYRAMMGVSLIQTAPMFTGYGMLVLQKLGIDLVRTTDGMSYGYEIAGGDSMLFKDLAPDLVVTDVIKLWLFDTERYISQLKLKMGSA